MKTLFTISMLIMITVASVVSYKLFFHAHYDISALLTIAGFMSIVMTVYVISSKKVSIL